MAEGQTNPNIQTNFYGSVSGSIHTGSGDVNVGELGEGSGNVPLYLPARPSMLIGRKQALHTLKQRLGIIDSDQQIPKTQVLTAMRGWPGVGKTTLASYLAYEEEVAIAYPDGVLWASLGPTPNLLGQLSAWGRALGVSDMTHIRTVEEAATRLRAVLRDKRVLLIVDDVWEAAHAQPFKIGGEQCATLFTTRIPATADQIAPNPDDVYWLAVLTDEKSLELLQRLAPSVVEKHPADALVLVQALEGLPLALRVAGHLLATEEKIGFDVSQLIAELREGATLIEAQAPADRADIAMQTTPTVAALLKTSTERLDAFTLDCFAFLGAFAPKPATFDVPAMQAVWEVTDARPTVRTLVNRGLLEPVGGRFQMHALLVMYAKSLLM